MREHQIVISLKSEHFQQVQRMARAAGSKSVGLFIRQRLLAALGLDGHEPNSEHERNPDWQRIAGQLRRLHRELQVFIAESIVADFDAALEQQGLRMPEENFLTEGAPFLPDYDYDYQPREQQAQSGSAPGVEAPAKFDAAADDLEKLADRAFAISPRLGALEPIDVRAKTMRDPLDELLGEPLSVRPHVDEEFVEEDRDQANLSASVPPRASSAHTVEPALPPTKKPVSTDVEIGMKVETAKVASETLKTEGGRDEPTEEPEMDKVEIATDSGFEPSPEAINAEALDDDADEKEATPVQTSSSSAIDVSAPSDDTTVASQDEIAGSGGQTEGSNEETGESDDETGESDATGARARASSGATDRSKRTSISDDESDTQEEEKDEKASEEKPRDTGIPPQPPPISGGPPPRKRSS